MLLMMPHFCTEFHVDLRILQLPSRLSDSQISRLALLFSPNTLETLAVQHLGISQAQIGTSKADNLLNTEGIQEGTVANVSLPMWQPKGNVFEN